MKALIIAFIALCLTACATPQAGSVTPIADDRFTMTVSKLGIDNAPLVPMSLNEDNTMEVPSLDFPQQLGLYELGPAPGEVGPAIITGHVNSGGVDGVFSDLNTMAVGDTITVNDNVFSVYRVETYPKNAFPTSEVYSDTVGPELRLITCGGALDSTGSNYLDNTVVYAKEV